MKCNFTVYEYIYEFNEEEQVDNISDGKKLEKIIEE